MEKKIRIAYLIDTISSDKAGTEKQLLNIIGQLDRDNFEITLICLHASPWMLRNRLQCEVVTLEYRGFLKPGFPAVLWRYLRVLREKQFDVVQTFFEDAIFVGYLGKMLSKHRHSLVISRRDLGLGADEPGYHRIYKKIMPFIIRSVDGIATNAWAIKNHIVEKCKVPTEIIQVIGNGLDLPTKHREAPLLFREYHADLWVGIVANLKPVKRIDLFLRALAHLKTCETGKGFRAVVLGEGHLRSELVQLATELGIADRVHFIGTTDNVSDYLYGIDIGVLCSDKEGLSNAIMEYMACALPVVATAVGGNCELVDVMNGICVPAGDYMALGTALEMLASSASLRKTLGAKSLEKVRNSSTWDKITPQWERYYRVLEGRLNC